MDLFRLYARARLACSQRAWSWQASSRTSKAPAPGQSAKAGPKLKLGERIAQGHDNRFVVIDGDTLAVGGHHWRLTGYDMHPLWHAPRRRQGGGAAGSEFLRSGKAVLEVTEAPDRWGRRRARPTINVRDVKDAMEAEGLEKLPSAWPLINQGATRGLGRRCPGGISPCHSLQAVT